MKTVVFEMPLSTNRARQLSRTSALLMTLNGRRRQIAIACPVMAEMTTVFVVRYSLADGFLVEVRFFGEGR